MLLISSKYSVKCSMSRSNLFVKYFTSKNTITDKNMKSIKTSAQIVLYVPITLTISYCSGFKVVIKNSFIKKYAVEKTMKKSTSTVVKNFTYISFFKSNKVYTLPRARSLYSFLIYQDLSYL